MVAEPSSTQRLWPALPLDEWKDTYATLHMWTQIVGKVRLAQTPRINHWWEVPLYVNACGLTTSAIPCATGIFEIQFDFLHHRLTIQTSQGTNRVIPLVPRSVADFYREFMDALHALDLEVHTWKMPVEIPNPIPFDRDTERASYDAEYVRRFWQILVSAHNVFTQFRADFVGKASPVHFFWGSFDLAVTRFSGRPAPPREGADSITREAYSHEVISHGFWPGGGDINGAAFYAYAAPEPQGFANQAVSPRQAFYHPQLHEYLLMYDDVRKLASPETALMEFLQSTYRVGADLAKWDRKDLEKSA